MPLVTFRPQQCFADGGGIWEVNIFSDYGVHKVSIVNYELSEVLKVRGDQVCYRDAIQVVLIRIGNHFPSAAMWAKVGGIKAAWGAPISCGMTQRGGSIGEWSRRGVKGWRRWGCGGRNSQWNTGIKRGIVGVTSSVGVVSCGFKG